MTPESRLDEYQEKADALAMSVVGLIPEELQPVMDGDLRSEGTAPLNGVTSERRPQDVAWWQTRADVHLVARENAAAEAIEAVSDALEADGWSIERVRETDGGETVTDGFRRGEWYMEIAWTRSVPGHVERFDISVVSPNTVRGDHDDIYS
ncbi:hypothetical protein [Microbacterium sp. NPDC087592]|uniref:hypothetical protein n=1 Tax=Microbacterium sp. NPDC087592 TaxID=3364193 RepID=UPI0037F49D18